MNQAQENPEAVQAFKEQIERSYEERILELEKLEARKANLLRKIKQSIISGLNPEKSEIPKNADPVKKILAKIAEATMPDPPMQDLRLTPMELSRIFETIKEKYRDELSKNNISNFDDFLSLLGLEQFNYKNKQEMEEEIIKEKIFNFEREKDIYFIPELQEAEICGKKLKISLPLGSSKLIIENLKNVILQIKNHEKDLEPFITTKTKLYAVGGSRIEFAINKNGEKNKYSATAGDFLRIIDEPSPEERKKWIRMASKFKKMKRISPDNPQIKELELEESFLRKECSKRILLNEESGMQVIEENNPMYSHSFSRKYFYDQYEKVVSYLDNKREEKLYENNILKKEIHFLKGNRTMSSLKECLPSGKIKKEAIFRQDGTLEKIIQDKNIDIYGKNGAKIASQFFDESIGDYRSFIYAKNSEKFATLDYMQKQNPNMTDRQYLEKFLPKNLDTYEKLHYYLKLFMRYTSDDIPLRPLKATDFLKVIRQEVFDIMSVSEDEKFQQGIETVNRLEERKMCGDCDDYSFLAQAIIEAQNKILKAKGKLLNRGKPYVVGVPGHAICVWIEKRPDGRYDAYSISTEGLDKNGNKYGDLPDEEKNKGYASIKEGINAIMAKYNPGLWNTIKKRKHQLKGNYIPILNITNEGKPVLNYQPLKIFDPDYKDKKIVF